MSTSEYKTFTLGATLTPEQTEFFDTNGFLHFRQFLTPQDVQNVIDALHEIEELWIAQDLKMVNGTPIKYGKDIDGRKIVQRFCFASLYHKVLHDVLMDPRFQGLTNLLDEPARIGENEKDGMVVNHTINTENSKYSRLGWHTDSLRDVFMGKKIQPMLNVGVHLNDYPFTKGGLRIIPGTHKQKLWSMLFRKKYFVDNKPDPEEVGFDIQMGDLTVHDGRLWHRVEQSGLVGEESRRRVIYTPIIAGKKHLKHANSRTPVYHRLQGFLK
ncbi:MAG: phytanoyl-CoA dioxygenase family protein [Bacteroidota bacterium]